MNERHANRISERFSEIVSGTDKGDILVAIFNTAPFLNALAGVELKDGLIPRALEEFQYMWDHLDHRYIEEYGCLEGVAMSFGPVELAAVIMGYRDFYLNLRAEPEWMHRLLAITTESVIRWLKTQEKINGRLKRIGITDHIPGQISQEHFEECWLPYSNQVVEEFPAATVIYHNEYPIPYIDALPHFKFHVWHFGGELGPVKAALGAHRTLMGNLHPIHVLLKGSPEEVYEKVQACLKEGATGGRFLLSSGGGLAPDTPEENIKSLERAWKCFIGGNG